jgi:hypothetical protein
MVGTDDRLTRLVVFQCDRFALPIWDPLRLANPTHHQTAAPSHKERCLPPFHEVWQGFVVFCCVLGHVAVSPWPRPKPSSTP